MTSLDEATLKKMKCPYKKGTYVLKERPNPKTANFTEIGVFIPSLFRIQHELESIYLKFTSYTFINQTKVMVANAVEVWSGKIEI
jgi:hypothetical protein